MRPQPAAPAPDPEASYYQAVEDCFVARRGDPLFLSNADWLLIRRWRLAGIPLRVVLRGVGDALDGHAHSWGRKRKVGSLAYCEAEVEAARDRWERAMALGREQEGSPAAALRGFAEAVERARGALPALREQMAGLEGRLRDWSDHPPGLRTLEPLLRAEEAALVTRLVRDLGPATVSALEGAADAELAPYATRMPAKVLAQIRSDSVARRVLGAYGLPRLSLFHL